MNYFLELTLDRLIIPAIIIGLIHAFLGIYLEKLGKKISWGGIGVGLLLALVFSIISNNVRLVNGWKYNVWSWAIFFILLFISIVLVVLSLTIKKLRNDKFKIVAASFTSLFSASILFIEMPTVYAYPFGIGLEVLTSDFMFALGGYILAVIISIVVFFGIEKTGEIVAKKSNKFVTLGFLVASIIPYFMLIFAKLFAQLRVRKIFGTRQLFLFCTKITNNRIYYIYAALAVAILMFAFLIFLSIKVKEKYSTPAEGRKIRATWIFARRWVAVLGLCFVTTVLSFTLFAKLSEEVIVVAEIEDYHHEDADYVYVAYTQVNDGHLHRFEFTDPDNGNKVRFIVIQKNASQYGCGLDACETCGDAGYYESDGQIICDRCKVIMNINTIGFKGGCNPIIIDGLEYGSDYIIIPKASLIAYEYKFTQ